MEVSERPRVPLLERSSGNRSQPQPPPHAGSSSTARPHDSLLEHSSRNPSLPPHGVTSGAGRGHDTRPRVAAHTLPARPGGPAYPAQRPQPPRFQVPTPKQHKLCRVSVIRDQVLADFSDISCTGIPTIPPRHNVTHRIETTGKPVRAKYRRLDPVKLQHAKQYFEDMVKAGICRRSSSEWSSPLHMVLKDDGSYRPCGDYRRLNARTKKNAYSLPNLKDCKTLG